MAKPRHPSSSPFFSLTAAPVQQGLFAASSYEAKQKQRAVEPTFVDERQVDLFAPPPPKKNPYNPASSMKHRIRLSEAAFAPLEVYVLDVFHLEGPYLDDTDEEEAATAREIERAVERLPNGGAVLHLPHDRDQLLRWHSRLNKASNSADDSRDAPWARSLSATASKVLEPLRERERKNPRGRRAKAGGEVGLNKEFYPGGTFLPTTQLPKGARPSYSGGSGRVFVAPGVLEVPPPGMRAIFASIFALVQRRPDGTIQPFPPSHPVWESGMYGSYEEAAAKCEAWNAGERFFDPRLRENDGSQKFIRRTPVQKRRGEAKRERKWRYVYDVDAALRGKERALIGEKIRLPYKGVFGHYEVLRRLPLGNLDNTVAVLHDETGHLMAINEACLRQLARDVYTPDPNKPEADDVRYAHMREDALPRSRVAAYNAILDASGIEDHDFSRADDAYAAWKAKKPKPKKPPPPWKGGQLDVFEGDLKNKKHFTSLLEAFEHATRGAKTWRDLEPVLAQLGSALGVPVRFPNDVLDRQGEHERDLRDFSEGIDVEQYGVTLEQSDDVEGDIFMAATMTPPAPESESEPEPESESEPDPEGMTMVTFIVPCGDAKLSHAAPARDLYTGSQFRYVFPLAEAAAERTGGEVFILSALHGLVEPDRVLEPYSKKMGDPGSITVEQLRKQVRKLGLAGREVYAFLPRSRQSPYYERLEAAMQAEGGHAEDVFDVPTKTARGGRIQMGEQKTRAREFLSSFTPRPRRPQWLEDEYAYLDERFERAMRDRDHSPSTVPPSTVPLLLTVTEGAIVAKASDGRRWRLDDEQAAECVQQMDAGETVDTQSWKQLPPEDAVPQEVEDHGEAVVEADMAQGDSVGGLRCVYFASGSNHQGEIEGLSSIGFNVGVAAPELSEGALQALTDLAGTGIRVFVDSGAFGEVDFNFPNATARPKKNRRSKRQIELGMVASTPPGGLPYPNLPLGPLVLEEITPARWRAILKTYRVLTEALGSQVYLVAPDCIGHQDETLRRLKTYAREIRELHRMGANIIVAMQKAVTLDAGHLDPSAPGIPLGKLSRESLDERIEAILGFSDFVRGMPMRNRTTTADEVVDFLKKRPHVMRVHLLGFGPAARDYVKTLKKLEAVRPDLDLTCDSVLVVAHKGNTNGPGGGPRRLTKAETEHWQDELGPESFADYNDAGDYTDAISEVSAWLPRSAREQLADQWGLDKAQRRAWLKDPEAWLQEHHRDDPERPKNYELPHVAVDLDRAWAEYNFKEKVVERKRVGIQRAFGPGSGFSLTREADEDE